MCLYVCLLVRLLVYLFVYLFVYLLVYLLLLMLAVGLVVLELRWWVIRACQFIIKFHSLLILCTPPYLLILHHALPPSALFLRLDQNFESNNGFWSRRRKLFTVWSDWEVFLLRYKYMGKASRVVAISGDWWRLVGIAWPPSLLPSERTSLLYYLRGTDHPWPQRSTTKPQIHTNKQTNKPTTKQPNKPIQKK